MRHRIKRCLSVFVLVCVALSACQTPSLTRTKSRTSIVLTTDCGADMDDQWALAHILLSPELELQAVITTHAAAIGLSSIAAAENASKVIATVVPKQTTPVIAGSSAPLADARTPLRNSGVDKLIELSRRFNAEHRLLVFIIGAGTDVASALLVDPTIANRIRIVAMGFDDWPNGGDGFNVKNDPLAWQVILSSRVPVVIGSNAVTKRDLRLTRSEGAELMRSHGHIGEYLFAMFDDWLTRRADLAAQFVAPETWVVWDEVVVAYALGLTRGDEVPRPRLQSDLSLAHPKTDERITWLTQIDTQRVWRDFVRKIDATP